MNNIWDIIETLHTNKLYDLNLINHNFNKMIFIAYLSQNITTIQIASYISQNLFFEDPKIIYLYAFSKYPKGKEYNHKWIKELKNIDLNNISEVFNSNINDAFNILKSISTDKLKIINNEINRLKENKIYLDDESIENHFISIINK